MTSKRPAENSELSEEKRQRVDESLNMDNNLQTTAGPVLTISSALIESNVSRVAEEVKFHKGGHCDGCAYSHNNYYYSDLASYQNLDAM